MEEDRLSKLSEEVERLNTRISELERLVRTQVNQTASPQPQTPIQPVAIAAPPPAPPVSHAAPPPPRPRPAKTTDLETEIGGNWLNKIGAVALVLGMAFFLKYAIDNRWINETGRVIIGLIIGLACVYGGEYFQKKQMSKYAQGISGAGIAILYFTIYASFAFYNLVPQLPAFAFMILITATAIALSVRHNAISIAILGILGGFLTPALLSSTTGGDSELQFFTYVTILNLGVLGITFYKNWRTLNILSLAGTVLLFAGWAEGSYEPKKLGITMTFLTIFFAIFAAQSFVQNVITRRNMNASDIIMVVAAPMLYFATSYSLLSDAYHIYLGAFAVLVGVVYIVLSQRVQTSRFEDTRLRLLFLAIAAGFLIVAVPIQLKQRWITIGWGAEALVLALIGFYMNSIKTRYIALGLLGLVGFRLLCIDTNVEYGVILTPFFNERFTVFLFSIVMVGIIAWLYQRNREQTTPTERIIQVVLVLTANFLTIWALSMEILNTISVLHPEGYKLAGVESLTLSAVWAIYGAIMLGIGLVYRFRPGRVMAMVILGIVIAKSFLYDVWFLDRLYRIIAFAGLGVLLLLTSYVYQAHRDKIRRIVGVEGESNA